MENCIEWTGGRNRDGYGRFWRDGRYVLAHRAIMGDPHGELVLHTCDNPGCVNPAHLYVGTRQDNMDDMARRMRGCHKLTEAAVRAIRASPKSNAEVARRYGVTSMNISLIRRHKTWTWV